MIPQVGGQCAIHLSILGPWPCLGWRLTLSLLSNRYRGGICLMGAEKTVSFSLFFFWLQGLSGATAYHPSYPVRPGSSRFVHRVLLSWPLFLHNVRVWTALSRRPIVSVWHPWYALKAYKEKDKSKREMLQIDQAGGQNEEVHTEM